ncbi:MAG: hypothetical protein KKB13_04140 [Chloroflexi bacterium]|nr:hypothetical protein [Chloroflexota bacterium]
MITLLSALRARRAAFAVWRELGRAAQYHPDGPGGPELLGWPVPPDPLLPLRVHWHLRRWAAGRAAQRVAHTVGHAVGHAVQRECFDLRVLAGALTRPGLVWVTAQIEVAGPDDEVVDVRLVPVQPGQLDEWFGRRRVDRAPSLTRRFTWHWYDRTRHPGGAISP